MRKKATYWGLGLAVALGLTVTAATSWQPTALFGSAIQTVAEGDATEGDDAGDTDADLEYKLPVSFTPADSTELKLSENVSQIEVAFKRDLKSINRMIEGDIQVLKGTEVIQTISPNDLDAVSYHAIDPYRLVLKINPLNQVGEYTIKFPAGLCTVEASNGTSSVETLAFEVHYTVVKDFAYDVTPGVGTYLPGLLKGQKYEITFPGATKVEIDQDIADPDEGTSTTAGARFMRRQTNNYYLASSVTLSAEGNKVTATVDQDAFYNCSSTAYYYFYLVLPEGALKITDAEGTVTSPEYTIGNYYTVAIPPSAVELTPAGNSKEMFAPEDMKNFTVKFNGVQGVKMGTIASYKTAYLRSYNPETGVAATTNVATYNVVENADGTYSYTMKDATSATAQLNNPQLWEKGYYVFVLPASSFSALTCDGKQTNCTLTTVLPPFYVDGVSTMSAVVAPEPGIVNPEYGLNTVKLTFTSAMEAMPDKIIKIYKKGTESTILYSFDPTNTNYVVAENSNKTWAINFPTLENVSGEYVIDVPEGTFRQNSGSYLNNEALELTYTFPETTPMVATPANGSYLLTTDGGLNEVTLTFPGATKVELVDPDATTNVWQGAYADGATTNKSVVEPTVDGTAIKLTLKTPVTAANANWFWFKLPGNFYKVTVDGKEYINPPTYLRYRVQAYGAPTIAPAQGTVGVDQLKEITLTPPAGYKFVKPTSSSAYARLFYDAVGIYGSMNTSSSNGAIDYEYKCANDSAASLIVGPNNSVTLVPKAGYNVDALSAGNYVLRCTGGSTGFLRLVPEDNESATAVYWSCPFDTYYTVTSDIKTVNLDFSCPSTVEVLPETFYLSAPEGGKLENFEGIETPKLGFIVKGNTSTGYDLTATLEADGRVKLELDSANYAKLNTALNKLSGDSRTIVLMNYNGTTKGSSLKAGIWKIPTTDGFDINAAQTIEVRVTGPVTDPIYTFTPASGIIKVAEHPTGIDQINIAVDYYLSLMPDYEANPTGMILKDGQTFGTFNTYQTEVNNDGEVVLSLLPALTESGEYTIVFPRGFFKVGALEATSKEMSVKYTVEGLEALEVESVTPANGSVLTSFTGVTVNFKGDVEIASAVANDIIYSVQNPAAGAATNVGFALEAVVNPDKKSILLTFSEEDEALLKEAGQWPVTNPGYYNIPIDANHIVITAADGTMYGNTYMGVQYEVIPETNVAYTPAEGKYFAELNEITATFDGMKTVAPLEFAFGTPSLKKGETTYTLSTPVVEGNKLTFTVDPAPTEVGDYVFNIPAHLYTLTPTDEHFAAYQNPELTHTFTIMEKPSLVRSTPANEAIVAYIANVNLLFSAPAERNKAVTEPATLTCNGDVIGSLTNKNVTYPTNEDDPNSVDFAFFREKMSTPGAYKFTVPAGFFTVLGVPTDEIVINFTIEEPVEWTIEPKANSMITSLPAVTLTFDGIDEIVDNKLQPDEEEGAGAVTIVNLGGSSNYSFTTTIEGNKVILTTNIDTVTPGQTLVTIPTGAYTLKKGNKSMPNQEIIVTYNTSNVPVPELTGFILDQDGNFRQNSFAANLTATLPEGTTYDMWLPGNVGALYSVDQNNVIEGSNLCQWYYDFDEYGSAKGKQAVTLLCNQPLEGDDAIKVEPGNYCIRFKKGTIMVTTEAYALDPDDPDNEKNMNTTLVGNTDIFYYYSVLEGTAGAVDSVFGDADSFNIYSVDGKIIKLNASKQDVMELENGVYIINGRTCYMRK